MDIERGKRDITRVKEEKEEKETISNNLPYLIVAIFLGSLLVVNIVMVVLAQAETEKKRAHDAAFKARMDAYFERK